tara:strand:- start:927 stop:1577 length:651 start_codon:yes stop_codon:yes gene_type:complete
MPFQNRTQQQKRGGFGGRGRGRGRGGRGRRNYRRRNQNQEKKAVFDNRIKYPKTVEDFKTYIAPGSTKWFELRKAEQAFWNSTAKTTEEKEQRFVTEDRISKCENYSDYLPRTVEPNTFDNDRKLVDPNMDSKGEYYHREVGPSGWNYSVESNKWNDFWKTRRGKRTAYYISYLNRRRKNRERFERMSSKNQQQLNGVPTMYKSTVEQSFNKVAQR